MRRRRPVVEPGGEWVGTAHYVRVDVREVRFVEMCPGGHRCSRDDVLHLFHVPHRQSRYKHLRERLRVAP